jgi:Delta3-Delta2-enoyl-CoA isomerase
MRGAAAAAAAATESPVRIERTRANGAVAIVWLESEPVNSMTLELWSALADALTSLENDSTVRRAARGA